MNELRFDGKSMIVTGGGRGFGRAHALILASRGAKVVVADYGVDVDGTGSSPEPAQLVAKEIEAAGGVAVPCFANVADEDGANPVVQTALDEFGRLDVVVNNAGICDPHLFEDMTMDRFRRMVDFHYLGTVHVTKAAWPHLLATHTAASSTPRPRRFWAMCRKVRLTRPPRVRFSRSPGHWPSTRGVAIFGLMRWRRGGLPGCRNRPYWPGSSTSPRKRSSIRSTKACSPRAFPSRRLPGPRVVHAQRRTAHLRRWARAAARDRRDQGHHPREVDARRHRGEPRGGDGHHRPTGVRSRHACTMKWFGGFR